MAAPAAAWALLLQTFLPRHLDIPIPLLRHSPPAPQLPVLLLLHCHLPAAQMTDAASAGRAASCSPGSPGITGLCSVPLKATRPAQDPPTSQLMLSLEIHRVCALGVPDGPQSLAGPAMCAAQDMGALGHI